MVNAFQIPGTRWTLVAGAAIPRYRFLSVNSDGNAILATATARVIGVSQNQTALNEKQEIQSGGVVIVEAASAITAGAAVGPDANGLVVSGGTAGTAITAATQAGQLVSVLM
jgi:hypothetical protein